MPYTIKDLASHARKFIPEDGLAYNDLTLAMMYANQHPSIEEDLDDESREILFPRLREIYGKPSFVKQVGFTMGEHLRSMPSGALGVAASVTDSDALREYAEDMRRSGQEKMQEIIAGDTQLQGLIQWNEDEPYTFKNFWRPDIAIRGLASALPSIIEMAAITVATQGTGTLLGLSRGTIGLLGNVARIGGMTVMEGGSIHDSTMSYYEKYARQQSMKKYGYEDRWEEFFDLEKAQDTAAWSYALYAPIAGALENFSFNWMFKIGGLGRLAEKSLGQSIVKRVARGVLSGNILEWARTAASTSLVEATQEWSQNMAQQIVESAWAEGYGNTPGEAADTFAKMVGGIRKNYQEAFKQHAWDEEARASFFSALYTGGLGGRQNLSIRNTLREIKAANKQYISEHKDAIKEKGITPEDALKIDEEINKIVKSKMEGMNPTYAKLWKEKFDEAISVVGKIETDKINEAAASAKAEEAQEAAAAEEQAQQAETAARAQQAAEARANVPGTSEEASDDTPSPVPPVSEGWLGLSNIPSSTELQDQDTDDISAELEYARGHEQPTSDNYNNPIDDDVENINQARSQLTSLVAGIEPSAESTKYYIELKEKELNALPQEATAERSIITNQINEAKKQLAKFSQQTQQQTTQPVEKAAQIESPGLHNVPSEGQVSSEERRGKELDRFPATFVPVRRNNPEGDNEVLMGGDAELAEGTIERKIKNGIKEGKSVGEILSSFVNVKYAFLSPEVETIKSFIEDRIAGKTNQTFGEFRQDTHKEINAKYDAELQRGTTEKGAEVSKAEEFRQKGWGEKYLDIDKHVQVPPVDDVNNAYALVDGEKVSLTDKEKDSLIAITKRMASPARWNQALAQSGFRELATDIYERVFPPIKGATPETTTQQPLTEPIQPEVKGINISSYGKGLAHKLSNLYYKPIMFEGTKYKSAEAAYQANKGTDLSDDAVKSLMTRVMTAKLEQNPDLVKGIDENGGMEFLNNSTHDLIKDGKIVKEDRWTGQNGLFMQSLREAYTTVKNQATGQPVTTVTKEGVKAETSKPIEGEVQTTKEKPIAQQIIEPAQPEIRQAPTSEELPKDFFEEYNLQTVEVDKAGKPVVYNVLNTVYGKKIVNKLKKQYPMFKSEVIDDLIRENGVEAYGKQLVDVVTWSKQGKLSTPPHEYFHGLMRTIGDHPVVRQAIKKFGSEEKLTQYVGDYYANRIQDTALKTRLKNWLQQFWLTVKKMFGTLSDDEAAKFVAESFYKGNILNKLNIQYAEQMYDNVPRYDKPDTTNPDSNENTRGADKEDAEYQPDSRTMLYAFAKNFRPFISALSLDKTISLYNDLANKARNSKDIFEFEDAFRKWVQDNIKKDFVITRKESNWMKTFFKTHNSTQLVFQQGNNGKKVLWELILNRRGTEDSYGIEYFGVSSLQDYTTARVGRAGRRRSGYVLSTFVDERSKDDLSLQYQVLSRASIFRRLNGVSGSTGVPYDFYINGSDRINAGIIHSIERYTFENWLFGEKEGNVSLATPIVFISPRGEDNDQLISKRIPPFLLDSEEVPKIRTLSQQMRVKGVDNNTLKQLNIQRQQLVNQYIEKTKNRLQAYLNKELERGNITPEIAKEMMDSISQKSSSSPSAYLGAIVRHDFLKKITHNKYLMPRYWKSITNFWDRLKIPFANGYNVLGLNRIIDAGHMTANVMIIPKDTVVKVNGESDVYDSFDGCMYTSSRLMYAIHTINGSKFANVGKFSIYKHSKDGEDYLALKMSNQTPKVGMQFFKQGETTPFAEVRKNEKTGYTYFYDLVAQKEFDMIASDNEVKERTGQYYGDDAFYKHIQLREENIKVVIEENELKDYNAFPTTMTEWLLNPNLNQGLLENLFKAYKNFVDRKFEGFLDYFNDVTKVGPNQQIEISFKKLREYMRRDLQEGVANTELQEWLNDDETGSVFVNKSILGQLIPFIANSMMRHGLYELRDSNSRLLVLSPAIGEGLNRGEFKVSRATKMSPEVIRQALIVRQPISSAAGAMVYKFMGYSDEETDTPRLYMHKDDVKQVLVGDWDIDKGGVSFVSDEILNALKSLQETPEFKSLMKNDVLEIFGNRIDRLGGARISDYGKMMEAYGKQAAHTNVIGVIVNMITTINNLAWKELSIKIGDKVYKPRNPNDIVVMDYAPLVKETLARKWDDVVVGNDRIVYKDKDGKYTEIKSVDELNKLDKDTNVYLKTDFGHVLSIWLQASVDAKKFDLLDKWNFSYNNFIAYAFNTTVNKDLRFISAVAGFFNTGRIRHGQDRVNLQKLGMQEMIRDSMDLADIFYDDKYKDPEILTNRIIEYYGKRVWNNRGLRRATTEMERLKVMLAQKQLLVTQNGKMTPMEYLVSKIGRYNSLVHNSRLASAFHQRNFLLFSDELYFNAHQDAVVTVGKKVMEYIENKALEISKNTKLKYQYVLDGIKSTASKFILQVSKEFYKQFESRDIDKVSVDYNTDMLQFIDKFKPMFDNLGEAEQMYATLHFLYAKPNFQTAGSYSYKTMQLLPKVLMHTPTIIEYSKAKLSVVNKMLNAMQNIDSYRLPVMTTDEIIRQYGLAEYKNLAFLKEMEVIDRTFINEIANLRC